MPSSVSNWCERFGCQRFFGSTTDSTTRIDLHSTKWPVSNLVLFIQIAVCIVFLWGASELARYQHPANAFCSPLIKSGPQWVPAVSVHLQPRQQRMPRPTPKSFPALRIRDLQKHDKLCSKCLLSKYFNKSMNHSPSKPMNMFSQWLLPRCRFQDVASGIDRPGFPW